MITTFKAAYVNIGTYVNDIGPILFCDRKHAAYNFMHLLRATCSLLQLFYKYLITTSQLPTASYIFIQLKTTSYREKEQGLTLICMKVLGMTVFPKDAIERGLGEENKYFQLVPKISKN